MRRSFAGCNRPLKVELETADLEWAAPGCSGNLTLDGQVVGTIGVLSPALVQANRFTGQVVLFELDLTAARPGHLERLPKYRPFSRFPSVSRDISMVIDRSVKHRDIVHVIRAAASKELEKVTLFDIFESENIGANKKSMAYSVSYRAPDRSFTDDEVNGMHEKVREALVSRLGAELR